MSSPKFTPLNFGMKKSLTWNFSQLKHYGSRWRSSGLTFATIGGLAFLYLTDWKLVVKKIPFYGGQFKDEEEE